MTNKQSDVKLFLEKLASDAEHLIKSKFRNLMILDSDIYHIVFGHIYDDTSSDVFQDLVLNDFNDTKLELIMKYLFRLENKDVFFDKTRFARDLLFLFSLSVLDRFKEIPYRDLLNEIRNCKNYSHFNYLNDTSQISSDMVKELVKLFYTLDSENSLAIPNSHGIDWKIQNESFLPIVNHAIVTFCIEKGYLINAGTKLLENDFSITEEDFLQVLDVIKTAYYLQKDVIKRIESGEIQPSKTLKPSFIAGLIPYYGIRK